MTEEQKVLYKGESIRFFTEESKKNDDFKKRLPDIDECACATCQSAIWRYHSKNGPCCYCPLTNEYTFKWDGMKLYEQVYECSKSQISTALPATTGDEREAFNAETEILETEGIKEFGVEEIDGKPTGI